jgi:hypothetical protein
LVRENSFVPGLALNFDDNNSGVPLYLSEVTPPQIRGRLMNIHGVMLGVGYVIAGEPNLACWFQL